MKTILAMGGQTVGFSTSSSGFFLPLGMSGPPSDDLAQSAAWHYHRVTKPGVLSNLRGYARLNFSDAASLVLYVNGAPTALSAVWSPSTGGWAVDSTHTVAVEEGDLVCCRFVSGAGSTFMLLRQIGCDFEADDGSVTQWLGGRTAIKPSNPSSPNNGGVRYNTLVGRGESNWELSGDRFRLKMPNAGKLAGLAVYVNVNSLSEPLLIEFDGSTVASSPTLTVPAGATGLFYVDGEMAFAEGDSICLKQRTASGAPTGSIGIARVSAEVSWSRNFILASWSTTNQNSAATAFPYLGGQHTDFDDEPYRQFLITDPAELYALRLYSLSNPAAGVVDTVRKNGVNTTVSLSPAATANTWAATTDHAVAFAAGDLISVANAWGGVSSANNITQFVLEFAAGGIGPLPVEIDVPAGELIVSGGRPTVVIDQFVSTSPGALLVTGGQATIVTNVEMDVPAGALVLTGNRPTVRVGVSVSASPDALVVEGLVPLIFTDFRAVLPQQAALAVVEPPPPPMRLSQQATLAAGYVIPPVAVSQQAVLILVDGSPCVTERCQLWRIKRRDGVEFRYTSLDRDVRYGGQVYKSCGSLNPSASEDASTLGTVSNIELEGIISDDGITEADLYGGLFDDAYVTVDLVAWGALPESPRRLASGWTGELSQGDTGFKMEVLGAGSRLDQQALVQMVTPGCRWVFGDSRCGKDLEAMKLTGEVTGSVTRSVFGASLSGDGAGRQWENGTVRFTSGVNEGQRLEVRSVDFAAGVVNLWPSAAFRAEPGDTFDLLPGCDKSRDGGCTLYANVINHGGFPDVPGNDAILETPDAQY